YILDNRLYFEEYVRDYTNASLVVSRNYGFKNGLFSGFEADKGAYDTKAWAFELDDKGVPLRDVSFKNPRCVINLLRDHYKRYTVDAVARATGTAPEDLETVYKAFAATGRPDKAGTILYAMGWTQHTYGVQNIRTMTMVQLLLGNIGVAGGGVNALRGESNVQGSTDHGLLASSFPGYLPGPTSAQASLADYNAATPRSADPMSVNWWQNRPKYMASLLKSFFPALSPEEGYALLPRVDAGKPLLDYYWQSIFHKMGEGQIKGLFAWGMNPACSGPNSNKHRQAMTKLDWMVNVNIFDNETGSFWRGPGMDPSKIKTEVFLLPCAVSIEKEGSVSNSGRWIQWRYAGPKPWGETKPDGDIMLELMEEIRKLYQQGGVFPEPVLQLDIDGWKEGHAFSPAKVAKIMNGYFTRDVKIGDREYKAGEQVPNFVALQADGSTASGNWLHAGAWTQKGNMMARQEHSQTAEQARIGLFPNWSFAWPANRRIIYNRASVDKNGRPWNPDKAVIAWDGKAWVGDIVDGGGGPGAKHPFIMQKDGFGAIYGPGCVDGPFPEYYEPAESPFDRHDFSSQTHSPVYYKVPGEQLALNDARYPYIGTTYRVTEHWQTGLMTRRVPWLLEAEPQNFAELDPVLARAKGISNGDKVILSSRRGQIECVAMVTPRLKPYTANGKTVHIIGTSWHFGWLVPKDGGDAANLLTAMVGDPNTGIPESKAFLVNIEKKAG
ncbi:formate dehydrogenase-N subunit alpha, partial [uncultured Desulfovibrio sp.]